MHNIRFLLIDSSLLAQSILKETIEGQGYGSLVAVQTVGEAVRLLNDDAVDFVICDWWDQEGPEIGLLKLVKLQPRFQHIPFLMTSSPCDGDADQNKVRRAAQAGVDGYLLKPYDGLLFKRALEDILARYHKLEY